MKHEPQVERHERGAKYLKYMFEQARNTARHEYLCFSNCDIVLTDDFRQAFEKARLWRERFLLLSRRWDTDITEPLDFRSGWEQDVRQRALTRGFRQDESWIDFFLFRKGMYTDMPKLIVGHCYWDNWMVWKALSEGVAVIDASPFVVPVHQNHGYDPRFGRTKGSPTDELSLLNLAAVGGKEHVRRIDAATHRMARNGEIRPTIFRNTYKFRVPLRKLRERLVYRVWLPAWHRLLGMTRPVRGALGLKSKASRQPTGRST